MKHYDTPSSTDGLRLPYSGFVVGHLAEALRLKTALREDFSAVSYKTVQRYFSGDRIKPESVVLILDALVDSLVPSSLQLGHGRIGDAPLKPIVRNALQDYARHWDWMVAKANSHMFEVTRRKDLPMPILRLVALDLGIRIGGWAALKFLMNDPINWEETWLDGDGLGRYIDQRRTTLNLTVEQLAGKIDVSAQTVAGWRSGKALPTSNHIEDLAKAISGDGPGRLEIEYTIRVLVAVQQVLQDLQKLIGEERLEDLVDGIKSTAQQVEGTERDVQGVLASMEPLAGLTGPLAAQWDEMKRAMPSEMTKGALWELPVHGARCEIGEATTKLLAEKAQGRPEAAADLTVLSGDWSPRITYWMSHIGSTDQTVEFMKRTMPAQTGTAPATVGMIAEAIMEGTLALGNMYRELDPNMHMAVFEPPPFGKAMNRVMQAETASSSGDMNTAVEHLRHAVRHQPNDASLHFKLGGALWQRAFDCMDRAGVEEALVECRLAVRLDPEFGNARNEIGVILSNLRRHVEAERAFAEAEPYHGHHSHHWFCRGNNYLALERLGQAKSAFLEAVRLTGKGEHVEAKSRLAAVLMALGEKREARRLGKRVHHVLGFDPTEQWEAGIRPWGRTPMPTWATAGTKVGRNERCPCGSGKKYKKCHGR